LGLNIFPFPRLYKDHGLNGFLSRDRSTIYVDEIQFNQFNEKYRYTFAHELGHYVLHQACYEDLPFQSPADYMKWRLSVPPDEISWFETQGEWFAGHLLVPTEQLERVCAAVVLKHQSTFKKFVTLPDDIWSYISNEVATHFDVNPPVVEIRIRKENIPAKITIG
jgi:Zn-dependent peptidase ImmA (M78 family)